MKQNIRPLNLSPQEMLCCQGLCLGFTYAELASKLGLSARTIESYIQSIYYKLQCEKRSDIVRKLLIEGYISIECLKEFDAILDYKNNRQQQPDLIYATRAC